MINKFNKSKIRSLAAIFAASFVLTGCSGASAGIDTRMLFHSKDANTGYETNIVSNPVYADFVTAKICAVSFENAKMEDANIPAKAAIMVDVTNNELVFAKNVYERIYPASTTKMLTALMVLKYGELTDEITIRDDNMGITTPGAKLCGFKQGDILTVDTLLNSLMIYSGNDAAIALAEYISGSEENFCELMNEEAKKLGAVDTHFVNAHGLHNDEHYTTAYDMYLIFMECLKYDSFRDIINQASYHAVYQNSEGVKKEYTFKNTNQFLIGTSEVPEGITVFGGKTGSTSYAGDCLMIYSENSDNTGYITGVFKASAKDSLYNQMSYLLMRQ